jgi:hypothetical protein
MPASVSYIETPSNDLKTRSSQWVWAEPTPRQTTQTEQTSSWFPTTATSKDEISGQTWTSGLGDRFSSETANALLGVQETAVAGSAAGTGQTEDTPSSSDTERAFYYDPLDTNQDGKVSYYEWLSGQASTTSTASTAAA